MREGFAVGDACRVQRGRQGPDAGAQLPPVMILCSFLKMFASPFHSTCNQSPHRRHWQQKIPLLFYLLLLFFFPFSVLLSICPLVCLICFLPDGETIFWMSPVLINGCQRPPCSADPCSEWQIILCHRESVRAREIDREGEREMLAATLSLLVASVIAAVNHLHRSTSETVWHLGGYYVQTLLQTPDAHISTQTHMHSVYTCNNMHTHFCSSPFFFDGKTFLKLIKFALDIPMNSALLLFLVVFNLRDYNGCVISGSQSEMRLGISITLISEGQNNATV